MAIVLGTTLVVGALFGMVDGGWGLAEWDDAVAEWGSRHTTSASTEVLDWVTDLGGTALLAVIVVAVGTYDAVRRRDLNGMSFLIVVAVGVVAINNLLKSLVDRPRPDVPHLVETSGSSFPSGHSSAAAATWLAVGWGWFLLATLVFSRREGRAASSSLSSCGSTSAGTRAFRRSSSSCSSSARR